MQGSSDNLSNLTIILVEPQLAENIGATARAMKNFGFHRLRLVNPRPNWPNPLAIANASHAADVVEQATIHPNIQSALADIDHLYAATARPRDMNKSVIKVKELPSLDTQKQVAILFGRESSGLTNHEISLANEIITICTASYSSLNIAQSVAVICHQLYRQNASPSHNLTQLCTRLQLQHFLDGLFDKLEERQFQYCNINSEKLKLNVTNLFSRIDNLSASEIQMLWSVVNTLTATP